MSKNEKIKKILESMDEMDHLTAIAIAKAFMKSYLKKLSKNDPVIDEEYNNWCNC